MLENITTSIISMHWAEVAAVFCGVIYVILAAKENIWCWFWGILNAILSIYLFYEIKLYAESVLYFYYLLAGFYGWYAWSYAKRVSEKHAIVEWKWSTHGMILIGGVLGSLLVYWLLANYTDAQKPLIDAHTTVFSFIATYMVTRKVLSNWIYWIIIDAISVWLYASRGIYLYALLMFFYTFLAWYGYQSWKRDLNSAKYNSAN